MATWQGDSGSLLCMLITPLISQMRLWHQSAMQPSLNHPRTVGGARGGSPGSAVGVDPEPSPLPWVHRTLLPLLHGPHMQHGTAHLILFHDTDLLKPPISWAEEGSGWPGRSRLASQEGWSPLCLRKCHPGLSLPSSLALSPPVHHLKTELQK